MIRQQAYRVVERKEKDASQKSEKQSANSSVKNQDDSIYYTRNKKILFWLYLLLTALFVATQSYLVSVNWDLMEAFSTSDNFYFANQITHQWRQGFISDIIIVQGTDCPDEYEPGFNYFWPGTGYGCFCQADQNNTFVLEGYCTAKLIQSQCLNILSQEERNANNWRNSSNICIKKSQVSFATQQKYNEDNKLCGSSQSLIVVPQDEPCPLVNLTFSLPTLELNYKVLQDSDEVLNPLYGTYNATSPYSFYSYPISKFTVSEYEFCLISEDSGLTPTHQQFILLNYQKGCANQTEFQVIDTLTQIQFYQNNPTLNELEQNKGFPKPGNWEYKLGFASVPSWTYYCRHNYDGKFSMPKALDIFNFTFFDIYYYFALVKILLCVVVGSGVILLAMRRALKKQVFPVGYRQQYLPKHFCMALIRYLVDFSCKIMLLGLVSYSFWVSVVNWNWFKSAINLECSDKNERMLTYVIQPFRDLYANCVTYTLAQLIVISIVGVLDIVHFIYIYRNELSFYLVQSESHVFVKHDKDQLNWVENNKYQIDKNIIDIQEFGQPDDELKSDKFKITMALNLFDNDNKEEQVVRGRKLKKSRKKKLFSESIPQHDPSLQISQDFNPYSLQDTSLIGLNSRDGLTSNQPKNLQIFDGDEEQRVRNQRKRGRRRGGK